MSRTVHKQGRGYDSRLVYWFRVLTFELAERAAKFSTNENSSDTSIRAIKAIGGNLRKIVFGMAALLRALDEDQLLVQILLLQDTTNMQTNILSYSEYPKNRISAGEIAAIVEAIGAERRARFRKSKARKWRSN